MRVLTGNLLFALVAVLAGCGGGQTQPLAPLPPLSGAPQSGASAAGATEYLLLPGDVLRVKFLYHPELDLKVPVRPDGTVAIQGVGVVRAQGHTADELARDIERMSSDHLRDPSVTVIVAEIGLHKVYVGGEVRSPGFVVFREGMTPMQAIFDRGGFTDVARIDSVLKVTYHDGGEPEATRLDFSETLYEGKPELSTLAVNDVLYIPRKFIGDADNFVRLYFHNLMPVSPRAGVGFSP